MENILLVIHALVALALVGVVLLQRSEGGALGIGGGGGGGGMFSSRVAANLLTRATAVLAAVFFLTSIALTVIHGGGEANQSIVDRIAPDAPVSETPDRDGGSEPIIDMPPPVVGPEGEESPIVDEPIVPRPQ